MNLREWALPVYTILIQVPAGALLMLWVLRAFARPKFASVELDQMIKNPILVITATTLMGMIGAHFHLSRPFHSFLAVLNLGNSWLSREIFFTVLFFISLAILWYWSRFHPHQQSFITILGWLAVFFGLSTVYCMSRIYILSTQEAWNSWGTIGSFFLTTMLLGVMTVACLIIMDMVFLEMQGSGQEELHVRLVRFSLKKMSWLALGLIMSDLTLSIFEVVKLQGGGSTAQASLGLLVDLYLPLLILRGIFLIAAVLYIANLVKRAYLPNAHLRDVMVPVYVASLLVFVGEIIGRFLFYAMHVRVGI